MEKLYNWDQLYERANDTACGSPELSAKDEARHSMREFFLQALDLDIESSESAEEEIDYQLSCMRSNCNQELLFTEDGDIAVIKLFPDDEARSIKVASVSCEPLAY